MQKLKMVLAAVLLSPALGSATVIAVLQSGPVPVSGGSFAYNYNANLSGDERLDPAATNGATCPGPGNTLIQCNPTGTFFTIYDVNGFQSVNVSAANWFSTLQFTGITPSSINGGTFDNPSVVNVTFFYTGPVVRGNGSQVTFSGFQIISSINTTNTNGKFTSQSTKDIGDSIGNTDQVVGPVTVPGIQTASTPEPLSMGLVGLGMTGIGLFFRRKR